MKKDKPHVISILRRDFPNHSASNDEKDGEDFGLLVGESIQYEWFNKTGGSCSYHSRWIDFHNRRLYARGQQSPAKYKEALKINGDNSYLNLDWSIIQAMPKFVDIVVNGMNDRMFKPKARAVDAVSEEMRGSYQRNIEQDMIAKKFLDQTKSEFGIDAFNVDPDSLPRNTQELELHMQMDFKPAIEIAEEVALDNILQYNDFFELKSRYNRDQVEIGMGAVKHEYVHGEGIRIKYVDPATIVHSYTEDPYFKDVFYWGEVVDLPILELKKINPNLTDDEIAEFGKVGRAWSQYFPEMNMYRNSAFDGETVPVMFFNYKTDRNCVYKKKRMGNGGYKMTKRDESFMPDPSDSDKFSRVDKKIDVWYEGAMVLGSKTLLKWELMKNMVKPDSRFQKIHSNYIVSSPLMYKGKTESLASRMIPLADQIQLTHLKFQQILQKMVPDGVFIDADGFTGVELGAGSAYGPMEAMLMYYQTGSSIGRSLTEDADYNNARYPITEIKNSAGLAKLKALAETYLHYVDLLRDVTGLNKASDASTPDSKSLVGLQKIAALNSNTATRHILDAGIDMTKRLCESLSFRISDVLRYAEDRAEFASQIGKYNMDIIEDIHRLPLHSYGIYIEVSPDAEEKATLEAQIQTAITEKTIDLEDAIDIRQISNIKMANEMLKLRRRRREEISHQKEMEKLQQVEVSQIKSAQVAAEAKKEALMIEAETKINVKRAETEGQLAVLREEAKLKKELMDIEFDYNMQLKGAEISNKRELESYKEDRKDKRVDKQSTQQSKMVTQRQDGGPAVNFESSEDTLDGIDLSEFGPK